MARNKKLLQFRYIFNKLHDNAKSLIVFAASLGCFLIIGTLTNFSWAGILTGCVASYVCLYLLRPIRRNQKY